MSSAVTTVENWLNDRTKDLSLKKTKPEVKEKAPTLISEARQLAGLTTKAADTVAAETSAPAAEPAAAPAPEKVEQDEKAVEQDERTLVGVLKEIADLFGIDQPIVVKSLVLQSSPKLTPPLRRQLVEDLGPGDKPIIYLAKTTDETLIANLIETDSKAFDAKEGTLRLPALDAAEVSDARDIKALGNRVGEQTFVRRLSLHSDDAGFSVDGGYDVTASGLITGKKILTEKERIAKARTTPPLAPEPSDGRFKPIKAEKALPYPQSSKEPFSTADYAELHKATVKLDLEDARVDLRDWRELGEAGRLSQVGSEGTYKYVITSGSVYEAVVEDTLAETVDSKLRAAVEAAGILAFMRAMAQQGKSGEVTYERFTELWKRSVNSGWLKDRFRDADASEGMHEWIPSNYIPETIARAADPDNFAEGAAWIDLHHRLRSDTELLIFRPEYWWEEKTRLGSAWIPQGHVGAVYAGDEAQTTHQQEFHDDLRDAFDRSTGIQSCIAEIRKVFVAWIWDGEERGKTPLYPGLRGKSGVPLNRNNLAARQRQNYAVINGTFRDIRAAFAKAKT